MLSRLRPQLLFLLLLVGLFSSACQESTSSGLARLPGLSAYRSATPGPSRTPILFSTTLSAATTTSVTTLLPPTVTYPPLPPTATPLATALPQLQLQETPGAGGHPTLANFWDGDATFVLEAEETGLPMGESDTIVMSNGEFWSYLHASQQSAGTVDQCGAPVSFPGCTVLYRSTDKGYTFSAGNPPVCQFTCQQCPCTSETDHVEQQQYPRLFYDDEILRLVYEYLGRVMLRYSVNGLEWSKPQQIAETGIWNLWLRDCPADERIGPHPSFPQDYECLAGGPPGIYVTEDEVYIFLAVGQNPGGMGCYVGTLHAPPSTFRRCQYNPLFEGAQTYGPLEKGPQTNFYFDFRILSSAEVQKLGDGEEARYYMLYEGVRGPAPGDPYDTQFGLGLARSLTNNIDGPWEKYQGNPILVDMPGNVGLGHADLVVYQGKTLLYTSLDGEKRSRLALVWKETGQALP